MGIHVLVVVPTLGLIEPEKNIGLSLTMVILHKNITLAYFVFFEKLLSALSLNCGL